MDSDGDNILDAYGTYQAVQEFDKPAAVIFKTKKGRGISFTEDTHKFHGAVIDDSAYAKGRPELLKTLAELEVAL